MQRAERKDIWFKSTDGRSQVAGYIYENSSVEPVCILQISHGMCEYIARYEDFASYLAAKGVVVCGNDHIGHGNSVASEVDLGYLGGDGGRRYAIADLKTMNDKVREMFPGIPLVLMGHSMGSFFARQYAVDYADSIDGLIIMGTGGPNPLAGIGLALTSLMKKIKGERYRSELIHHVAFGAYNKRIEKPDTEYDWISRDKEIVAIYAKDPKCTFRFTVNGFQELMAALKDVSSPSWAEKLPKEKPILMVSGDADPVGDYGHGVEKVYAWLQAAGVKNLTLHIYPGMRHEVLNEIGRQEVYENIGNFLQQNFGQRK